MYCSKHNVATYGKATCRACELEDKVSELEAFARQLAELLQAYYQKDAGNFTIHLASLALKKANEYGLIRKQ